MNLLLLLRTAPRKSYDYRTGQVMWTLAAEDICYLLHLAVELIDLWGATTPMDAAWDTYVLSGLLTEAQALAVDEGLIGLAVALEHAVRLLNDAEDLYAFAGRDESETDAHVTAANERWFGPDVEAVMAHTRSPEAWLLHGD